MYAPSQWEATLQCNVALPSAGRTHQMIPAWCPLVVITMCNFQLMMTQDWISKWLGAIKQQAITWSNVKPNVWHYVVSRSQWGKHMKACQTIVSCFTHSLTPDEDFGNHQYQWSPLLRDCSDIGLSLDEQQPIWLSKQCCFELKNKILWKFIWIMRF